MNQRGFIPLSPQLIAGGIVFSIVVVMGIALKVQTARLHSSQAALEQTKAEYAGFKAEVSRIGEEAKKRVADENMRRERVTKERESSYEKRLAALNFAYGRLRDQSGASSRPMPPVPNAPVCTDGSSSRDQLLAVLRAADEQTLRLLELQEWVREQKPTP